MNLLESRDAAVGWCGLPWCGVLWCGAGGGMVVAGVVCRGAGAVVVEVAGVVCRDAGVVWCSVVWCWRWLGAKRVARSVLNTVAAHRPSSQRATHATRPVATPGSQLET